MLCKQRPNFEVYPVSLPLRFVHCLLSNLLHARFATSKATVDIEPKMMFGCNTLFMHSCMSSS